MSLTILSLGAGVQSSTLALMSELGQLPRLDCAIFADTGSEPKAVYEWLNWLEKRVSFPIYRVAQGNLTDDATETRISKRSGNRYCRNTIPVFTKGISDKGQMPRTCTMNYKISPIRRKVKELLKASNETLAEQWIGISTDEIHRMKDSRVDFIENVFPLVDLDMNRADCLQWAESHGIKKPPRSACVYCPFRSDKEWLAIKTEDPDNFELAIKFEKDLQKSFSVVTGWKNINDPPVPFLHKSRIPLGTVEFDGENQLDLFGQECEGMCGL
jgi:hypothetical protein